MLPGEAACHPGEAACHPGEAACSWEVAISLDGLIPQPSGTACGPSGTACHHLLICILFVIFHFKQSVVTEINFKSEEDLLA